MVNKRFQMRKIRDSHQLLEITLIINWYLKVGISNGLEFFY
jgi:hypothetical protein